ncbi:MAG: hypothetical protein K8T25_15145, partial [Planctomycetia bacterium]|nr:hypothetical protein [Planctomycetia bacterium]
MKYALNVCAALLLAGTLLAADQPAQPAKVKQIKVQPDKGADVSSLKSIVQSITRDAKTNDQKAISVYNFMLISHFHCAYPQEKEKIPALKCVNVYGWGLCGGLHAVQGSLYRELGWKWRFVGWSTPGHTTVEAEYDGRWHYLDSFLKFYAWMPDPADPTKRTIAGEEDIKQNPGIVTDNFVMDESRKLYYAKDNRFVVIDGKANWTAPSFLGCGDPPNGVLTGTKSSKQGVSPPGWAVVQFDGNYSADVNLAPGYSLTLTWEAIKDAWFWGASKKAPEHSCSDKDYRNDPVAGPIHEPYRSANPKRSWANGKLTFSPDLSSEAVLKSLAAVDNAKWEGGALAAADAAKPASVTIELQSPYVISRAQGEAEVDSAEVSTDGGKKWKKVALADFSADVAGSYSALVKLTFSKPLKALKLEAIVQCNRGALPYLSPGKNKVAVSLADAKELGDNKLVVTYAYNMGSRGKTYEQLCDSGNEIAKGHSAVWSDKPTVVQKTFAAADLPATIEIDIPTPKDKQPVYPRMLFVRREVISANAKPLPLPEGAAEAKPAAADELKELPNPFTIGYTAPAPVKPRKTVTKAFELQLGHAVSQEGEVAENHFIKTAPKETWFMLVGGELKGLPAAKEIAAARLMIPVVNAHPRAPTKAAVTLLAAPFEANKPYDFAKLGEPAGTGILPKQPETGNY